MSSGMARRSLLLFMFRRGLLLLLWLRLWPHRIAHSLSLRLLLRLLLNPRLWLPFNPRLLLLLWLRLWPNRIAHSLSLRLALWAFLYTRLLGNGHSSLFLLLSTSSISLLLLELTRLTLRFSTTARGFGVQPVYLLLASLFCLFACLVHLFSFLTCVFQVATRGTRIGPGSEPEVSGSRRATRRERRT